MDNGFNFRASSGFVTDGANETYVLFDDAYPTTRGGRTFGYEQAMTAGVDRDSGVDRRLAGINYIAPVDESNRRDLRVDLDVAGAKRVHLAIGDFADQSSEAQSYELLDSTTSIADYNLLAIAAGGQQYLDAGGNQRSGANWPTLNTPVDYTFASAIFRLRLGGNSSGYQVVAHLRILDNAGEIAGPLMAQICM